MRLMRIEGVTIEHLNEIVPEKYYFWLQLWNSPNNEILMYILTENKETIGTAIYQVYRNERKYVCCAYVEVLEAYRRKGYATKLLRQTKKELNDAGYNNIWAIIVQKPDEAVIGLLKKVGMTEQYKETNMGYFVGKLKESKIAPRFANAGAFKYVKKIDEISDFAIRKLEKRKLIKKYNLLLKNFNRKLSRFYVVDDEVRGVLLVDSKDDEIFYTVEIAVDSQKNNAIVFPLMLFSLIGEISERAQADAGLIISFNEERHVEAMEKYCGESEENIQLSYWKY